MRARQLVLEDKKRYDHVWMTIITDPFQLQSIETLQREVALVKRKLLNQPQQFNRCRTVRPDSRRISINFGAVFGTGSFLIRANSVQNPSSNFLSYWSRQAKQAIFNAKVNHPSETPNWGQVLKCGIPGTIDIYRPVDSLDQLFYQARTLNPILIQKVKGWAAVSGGLLRVSSVDSNSNAELRKGLHCAASLLKEEEVFVPEFINSNSNTTHGEKDPVTQKENEQEMCSKYENSQHSVNSPFPLLLPAHSRQNLMLDSSHSSMRGCIIYGSVKSAKRAIEKATRSYGQVRIHLAWPLQVLLLIVVSSLAGCIQAFGSLQTQHHFQFCL